MIKQIGANAYGVVEYAVSFESEVEQLPTAVGQGSVCVVLENTNVYMFDESDDKWKLFVGGSSSGGGSGIPGIDGREIELQKGETAIQWRYVGDEEWNDLVALGDLKGNDGANGENGQDGVTPNIQVGAVTTLEPGEEATVTITGTKENPVLDFGIPRGENGVILNGKKILAIGDSFVQGNGLDHSLTWVGQLASRNNMVSYNYGLNGSCIADNPSQTIPSVMDRYEDILNTVKDVDYVLVLAGHNDSNSSLNGGSAIEIGHNEDNVKTTYKGALNILINALINAYPTAKILFLTPFNRRGTEKPYVEAMKEICGKYSIPCFDNFHSCGIDLQNATHLSIYEQTSLHFNEKGHERISYLYESILKNNLVVNYSCTTNNEVNIDTSDFVTKTDMPFNMINITKENYDALPVKNINTVYLVEGYGLYLGVKCIISSDNQQGTGSEGGDVGSPLNKFVLGSLISGNSVGSEKNRACSLKNELIEGDIIGFQNESMTETYKFAVDDASDSLVSWIDGGYQTAYQYVIKESGSYNFMIARKDNADISEEELNNLNSIFKKFN